MLFLKKWHCQPSFNNKMINIGQMSCRVSLKTALNWLLYVSCTDSEDVALSALSKYAQLNYTPFTHFIAVSEIVINETVQLADGVRLIPFSEVPRSSVTDALDPTLLKPEFLAKVGLGGLTELGLKFSDRVSPPEAVLVKSARVSPKFDNPVDHAVFGVEPEPTELIEACECITLIAPAAPLPIARWVTMEEWVPCSGFIGVAWSRESNKVIGKDKLKLNETQLGELRDVFDKFRKLPQIVRDKLRVPIQFLNQSRRSSSVADRAINLGVAFEALYLNDRSSKEQIAFTFRLRAAWHLGESPEARMGLMDVFNKIYGCRSNAVHTGKLKDTIKVKSEGQISTHRFLDRADVLCVRAILKVIDDGGFPNWQAIIIGLDSSTIK
jgi:hypothetical protein